MTKIGIIIGSTRPSRVGDQVAKWVYERAVSRKDAEFELIDLRDYNLPLLDEPLPPGYGKYENEHTKVWSKKVAELDGYIFVTPEYNHTFPASLKNAIDFVYTEWNNKAASFVSYGAASGSRAVEQLRPVMSQMLIADIGAQVMFSLFTDFENGSVFKPDPRHEDETDKMIDQLLAWTEAMKTLRKGATAPDSE